MKHRCGCECDCRDPDEPRPFGGKCDTCYQSNRSFYAFAPRVSFKRCIHCGKWLCSDCRSGPCFKDFNNQLGYHRAHTVTSIGEVT